MLMLMLHKAIALLLMPIRSRVCSARRGRLHSTIFACTPGVLQSTDRNRGEFTTHNEPHLATACADAAQRKIPVVHFLTQRVFPSGIICAEHPICTTLHDGNFFPSRQISHYDFAADT